MKRNLLFFISLIFFTNITSITAQREVCESPEDLYDANSITKCTVEDSKTAKKTRQITVKVSASKRFLKKRKLAKKQTVIRGITPSDVQSTNHSNIVLNNIALKTNIDLVKDKLSADELKKASKLNEVDKIPAFKVCESTKKEDRIGCFNHEMMKHIQKHFHYPSKAIRESIKGQVWVRFVIGKDGNVMNIKTLGPKNGEILNNVAQNVVAQLPQFIPAKKNGQPVAVKYGFPIAFSLED